MRLILRVLIRAGRFGRKEKESIICQRKIVKMTVRTRVIVM